MDARTATAIFVAMCTTQVAFAADGLGPPPTFYDWTGVYVGANAGYASAKISQTVNGSSTTSSQTISGAIAGGQIGAGEALAQVKDQVRVAGPQ